MSSWKADRRGAGAGADVVMSLTSAWMPPEVGRGGAPCAEPSFVTSVLAAGGAAADGVTPASAISSRSMERTSRSAFKSITRTEGSRRL